MRLQPLACEAGGASTVLTSTQSSGKQNPGCWTVCMCNVNSFANQARERMAGHQSERLRASQDSSSPLSQA